MNNYFELYEIPVSFTPDQDHIKKKYYELSKKYHPDRFTLADNEAQENALKVSSLNNEAFNTFKNTYKTIAYVLKHYDVLEDEEKYSLPPDFLMEMMDINEAVSDIEDVKDNSELLSKTNNTLKQQLESWENDIAPLINNFDETNPDKELLLKIKDYYFRKKYLLRIKNRLSELA